MTQLSTLYKKRGLQPKKSGITVTQLNDVSMSKRTKVNKNISKHVVRFNIRLQGQEQLFTIFQLFWLQRWQRVLLITHLLIPTHILKVNTLKFK
jgi:hypothetical protein